MNHRSWILIAGTTLALSAFAAEPIKPSAQQIASLCNDCRIVTAVNTEKRKGKASGVGAVGGAVAGGVIGDKVGDSTTATVGGAVLGGIVGHQVERQVKRQKVWVVTTTGRDGQSQRHELGNDPNLKAGDVVTVNGNNLQRR